MATKSYYVSAFGGGRRYFVHLNAALRFAKAQARASWSQQDWSVWDATTGTAAFFVTAHGGVYDPFDGGGRLFNRPAGLPVDLTFIRPSLTRSAR